MTGPVLVELRVEGSIAEIVLARAPVNAIDAGWLEALEGALDGLERAPAVSAVLVRSSQRLFCAGADLALMRSRYASAEGRVQFVAFVGRIQQVFARLERLPKVTIAAIGGAALGGGLELALACDLRITAAEAKLGLPEARLGLLPGAGGTQRLPRIAGEAVARRMILGAEVLDGAQAAALGVVQWAVPQSELDRRSRELVEGIAALPAAAVAACKRCLRAAADPAADGYAIELEETLALLATDATQERVRRFLEKSR